LGPADHAAHSLEAFAPAPLPYNAISACGFDRSLLAYLSSEEFHQNPPNILILEFATHFDMAQKSFYRLSMPLVDTCCSCRKTFLCRKVKLCKGRIEVLLNISALAIRSVSYVAAVSY
ncbi:alginate O-acetyltransferase, partial [Pseudomonas aeruginosa]